MQTDLFAMIAPYDAMSQEPTQEAPRAPRKPRATPSQPLIEALAVVERVAARVIDAAPIAPRVWRQLFPEGKHTSPPADLAEAVEAFDDHYGRCPPALRLRASWDRIRAALTTYHAPVVDEVTPAMIARARAAYFKSNPAYMSHDERLRAAIHSALNVKAT